MRLLLLVAAAPALRATAAEPLLGISLGGAKGAQSLGVPMQIAILLTLLAVVPAVVMSLTPFLRIVVVLHFLRQALGTQSTPSNQVLIGLALFLSILIMQPVLSQMYTQGWEPVEKGQLALSQGMERAGAPLKAFLIRFAREKDVKLLVDITHSAPPRRPADLDFRILMPAYILSELKTAFQIGAVLFLPFLIIDLVVASVTLSIGMIQLPPVMLSAPFKVLLFVLVDGWNLVVGSLVRSFY